MERTKKWHWVMMLTVVLWASSTVGAMAHDIYDVFQGIQDNNARWVPGENPISRLSDQERRNRLGHALTGSTMGKPIMSSATPLQAAALPTALDWRNNSGDYVTSVKDQGNCGSCWAFADVATLESIMLIAGKDPGTNVDESEQIMISCSGAGSCSGGATSLAAEWLQSTGDAPESYYPYTATNGSCSSALSGWQAQATKISGWVWITTTPPTATTLKQGLNTYGPLSVTMNVYEDFFYYTSGVYQHVSGSLAGGHAIELVGYNDAGQYFIAKNSWGTEWGEQGFFQIAYSELTSVTQFGAWAIGYTMANPPTPGTCTYSISTTGASMPLNGGTGTINVTATGSSCSWTAQSNEPWITITAGAKGTGNGIVSYSVAPNSPTANMGAPARSGTISVAGYTFTVNQANLSCTYTTAMDSSGTTGAISNQIDVSTSDPQCPWTATSQVPWISVTSGASGTGNGVVKFTMQPNQSVTARTGQLFAAGTAYTFSQEPGLTCTYAVTPASFSEAKSAGSFAVTVSTPAGCTTTPKSNASWLTVSGATLNGTGATTVSYQANTTGATRSGTLTFGTSTVTVTQAAK